MAKSRYIVQGVEGFSGLEFLADPPVNRRRYLPGEEVELDDAVTDVETLLRTGVVVAKAVKAEPAVTDNNKKEE